MFFVRIVVAAAAAVFIVRNFDPATGALIAFGLVVPWWGERAIARVGQ